MRRAIARQIHNGTGEVDVLTWMGRAALELVGQGGLGYSFESFESDNYNNIYANAIKQILYLLSL